MPFYEYRRPDGTTIEVMQRMSDPPLTEDPETGVPLERVFHPIAVHFKGKGFYNTDYGTKNRAREKAEGDGSGAARSGDSSSGAEKPGDSAESAGAAKGDGAAKGETSSKPSSAPKRD